MDALMNYFCRGVYKKSPALDAKVKDGYCCHLSYGSSSIQGWRINQEDRADVHLMYDKDFSFFGVYDGHGGPEVAEYLKRNLYKIVLSYLKTESPTAAVELAFNFVDLYLRSSEGLNDLKLLAEEYDDKKDSSSYTLKDAIFMKMLAYAKTQDFKDKLNESTGPDTAQGSGECSSKQSDGAGPSSVKINDEDSEESSSQDSEASNPEKNNILNYLLEGKLSDTDPEDEDYSTDDNSCEENKMMDQEDVLDVPIGSNEPGMESGSTATIALFSPNQLFVANVGDSRCMISKKGCAIDISIDHTPELKEERMRIEATDCFVSDDGRINSSLNLSRAIGDFVFKKTPDLPLNKQSVSSEPHVAAVNIDDEVDFIVIASDGIWNCITSQDVCDFIILRLTASDAKLSTICEELSHHCMSLRDETDGTGMDNITMFIICPNTSRFSSNIVSNELNYFDDATDSESDENVNTSENKLNSSNEEGGEKSLKRKTEDGSPLKKKMKTM